MFLQYVVVECYLSGHINMARCIRLFCVALMYNISMCRCRIVVCPGAYQHPGFFMLKIQILQIGIVEYETERGGTNL